MTRSSPPQRSFASGEISPTLAGRTDYVRHQTGLAKAAGFIPIPEGGFTRAPGTIYEGRTRGDAQARLIEFEFAVDDAVVLELTAEWMRFWRYGQLVTSGGSPYEIATPWNLPEIKQLKFAQTADVTYFADGKRAPRRLRRFALDDWQLDRAPFSGGPLRPWNTDQDVSVEASAATGSVTLTATGGDVFDAGMIGSFFAMKVVDWSAIPLWTGNTVFSLGDKVRYDGRVYECTDEATAADKNVSPPSHATGTVLSTKDGPTWKFISTDRGLVEITAVASATSATAQVIDRIPDEIVGGGTWDWAAGAWSDLYGWPAAVTFHDQRSVWAATESEPRTVWASGIGDYLDFAEGVNADEAFAYQLATQRGLNRIVWLQGGQRGLHIGATGEVQGARSTVGDEVLSIESAAFGMIASIGAHHAQPIAPMGKPIYVSRDRSRVLELRFQLQEDSVQPLNLSLPARHLGAERFDIIAWQSSPLPIAWIVRRDGDLVAMIYDAAEDVLGWCTIPMAGGVVEEVSVTAAPDGGDDEVRVVVRRTIGGETRRHVERLAPFWGLLTGDMKIAEACHLYAAAEKIFEEPGQVVDGLEHLEGEDVLVWTDKGQFGPYTVASGRVTLELPVSRAWAGLNDDGQRARTLSLYAATRSGDGMGRQTKLTGAGVRLQRTAGYRIRAIESEWGRDERVGDWFERNGQTVPGDLVKAWSGVDPVNINAGWAAAIALEFAPLGAAPMTVLALTPTVEARD
ncbi:hypothetical protein [Albimonas pacifica]|uniref:Uncharacterized protein n=1 Tax=Albimonas pacifica TaxID=1114924 RepID=A0A1I3JL21_9RHOB|nr:hypothetical protein [Albimonas pacifica]SFI60864.1 hypothetical protein SAMN05216258_10851 [Albimonas pacifica]